MATIKDHVSIIRKDQDLLPGGDGEDFWPPHHWTHEDGGNDEVNVEGLDGKLADPQNAGWIQDRPVTTDVPNEGDALVWNETSGEWEYGIPADSLWRRNPAGFLYPATATDVLQMANGTKSLPAYGFAGGTGAGWFYDIDDDTVHLAVDGIDQLWFNNLTPYNWLEIRSNRRVDFFSTYDNTVAGSQSHIGFNASSNSASITPDILSLASNLGGNAYNRMKAYVGADSNLRQAECLIQSYGYGDSKALVEIETLDSDQPGFNTLIEMFTDHNAGSYLDIHATDENDNAYIDLYTQNAEGGYRTTQIVLNETLGSILLKGTHYGDIRNQLYLDSNNNQITLGTYAPSTAGWIDIFTYDNDEAKYTTRIKLDAADSAVSSPNQSIGFYLDDYMMLKIVHSNTGATQLITDPNSDYAHWKFELVHRRTTTGPPADISMHASSSASGAQMFMTAQVDSGVSNSSFSVFGSEGGTSSTANFVASNNELGSAQSWLRAETKGNAQAIISADSMTSGNGTASTDIRSRSYTGNAYVDIFAYTDDENTLGFKSYIRIGYTTLNSAYKPDFIRFYMASLESSIWANKYWNLATENAADWNTFKTNFGEISILEAFNALYSGASGFTPGSIIFAGSGGELSENYSQFRYLDNGLYMEVGDSTASTNINIRSLGTGSNFNLLSSAQGGTASGTFTVQSVSSGSTLTLKATGSTSSAKLWAENATTSSRIGCDGLGFIDFWVDYTTLSTPALRFNYYFGAAITVFTPIFNILNEQTTENASNRMFARSTAGTATNTLEALGNTAATTQIITTVPDGNGTCNIVVNSADTSGGYSRINLQAIYNGGASEIFLREDGIRFDDLNRTGWTQTYLKLSDSPTGWSNYKTQFGEVGLLEAIYAASQTGGGGIPAHNDTTGKQGGTTGQYYHLTAAQHTALTTNQPFTGNRFALIDGSGALSFDSNVNYTGFTAQIIASVPATNSAGILFNQTPDTLSFQSAGTTVFEMSFSDSQALLYSQHEIHFDDENRSGWTQTYLALSDTPQGWTDYAGEFGEVGLLEAIYAASQTGGVVRSGATTDNTLARWNGASADSIQGSGIVVDDSNNVSGVGNISLGGSAIQGGATPVRLLTYAGTTLYLGQDTGGDLTGYIDFECSTQFVWSLAGSDEMYFSAAGLDLQNNHIIDVATLTFESWGSETVSGGAATVTFDEYQKVTVNLNNTASVTITLNTPNGPGNFMIELVQGSTTPTTSITWVTEGTAPLDGPTGGLSFNQSASGRTAIGVYYTGSRWAIVGTPLTQILSS